MARAKRSVTISRGDAKSCVQPGWHLLLDGLYNVLAKYPAVCVVEVKEKFGVLTVYHMGGPIEVHEAVNDVALRSRVTCEVCGVPGWIDGKAWQKALCAKHHRETEKRRARAMKGAKT